MNFKIEEILRKASKNNFITFEQAKQVYLSEFYCVKQIMREGIHDEPETFKNINLILFGKIYAKKGVIEKMRRLKNLKKKNDER